jgi:hypothetical protein
VRLDQTNVDKQVKDYLESANSIGLPALDGSVLAAMHHLKRGKLGSGPYPDVSLFEASNRILSDIVILLGVQRLLSDPTVGRVQLPFDVYEVALGVESGNDVTASAASLRLIGEVFNVAPSFFQTKKRSMIKKLRSQAADYRLIIFNADAVRDPQYYVDQSERSMLYLPVDVLANIG